MVRRGVLVFQKTPTDALERLVRASGATVSSRVDALDSGKLGSAGRVEVGKRAWTDVVFVEECPDSGTVTLLLRGGPTHVMDELKRPVVDAISVTSNALEKGAICPGGCAMEVEIASQLRQAADRIATREQLAVDAFADALETLPKTIAESAGLDPIDAIVELRREHAAGNATVGIDGQEAELTDAVDAGIVDSVRVKRTAIETAAQAAIFLLRVDDVLLSEKLPDDEHGGTDPGMPR
ncbi:TCP-1/cpn60 chaperonin family protein [Saliphagus sp. GCM10025308]